MWGIELNRCNGVSLKRQIYEALKVQMLDGRLREDDVLPSTRELSRSLNVSRGTVNEAYDMLIAEGFVVSHQGASTRVAEGLYIKTTPSSGALADVAPLPKRLTIDFQTGKPDLRLFPQFSWRQLLGRALADTSIELYNYSGPQGLVSLREELSAWLMRGRGLAVDPDDIFITAGATHALHILSMILCGDGRQMLVEDPCHDGMRRTFLNNGCAVTPIPVDSHGMQTRYLPQEGGIGALYVTPSHQFPFGGVLPATRRAALIRYAQEHDAYIIEDDYDSEFRYSGDPISPLHALDPQRVIYVGTFSKVLFPALRIGYAIIPERLRKQWILKRTYIDVQSPLLEQVVLAEFIRTRKLEGHILRMRKQYGQRRDTLLNSLREYFGDAWVAYGDAAGLHMTIDFPEMKFDEAFAENCLQRGMRITPLERHCIKKGQHISKLLIGYGHLEPSEITQGIQYLSQVMRELK
jgi:GntR family transcriptional regulator / MocR family aminotransferase